MLLQVSLARQGHQLQQREVVSIRLPGFDGSIGFMANRRPIIGMLKPGLIFIHDELNEEQVYATTGGFYEMKNNHLMLLLDNLFTKEDGEKYFPKYEISTDKFYFKDTEGFTFKEKFVYILEMLKRELE